MWLPPPCFAVAQEGCAAAEEEDAEGDDGRGVAKEEEVRSRRSRRSRRRW